MSEQLEPNTIDATLAMIDMGTWGAKASLVSLVRLATFGEGQRDVPVQISQYAGAAATGIGRRYVHKLLADLVDERVLLFEEGAGSRAHGYRLNPDVRQWRVPFRVERERALLMIAWIGTGARRATATPVVTRPSALLSPFATRPGASQFPASNAPQRVPNTPLDTRPSASQTAPDGASSPSSLDSLHRHDDDEEAITNAMGAIFSATNVPLFGEPKRRVLRALARAEHRQRVIEAIAGQAGRQLGPEGIACVAEQAAVAGPTPEPARAYPDFEPLPDEPPTPPPPGWRDALPRRDNGPEACEDGER